MALFVIDVNYSDGSTVRIHHTAPLERQVKLWFAVHRRIYERPGLMIISVLILRADDASSI